MPQRGMPFTLIARSRGMRAGKVAGLATPEIESHRPHVIPPCPIAAARKGG